MPRDETVLGSLGTWLVLGLSAHLSTLYSHLPFADRVDAAADDGFRCVEFWSADEPEVLAERIRARGLSVSAINVDGGPEPGDAGGLSNGSAVDPWRQRFTQTVELARRLGCPQINAPAGAVGRGGARKEALATALRNLDWALEQVARDDVGVLLEPLSLADRPGYLLPTLEDAEAVREMLGSPEQVKILFDTYHLHQTSGDVAALFERYAESVGHVQIADHPGRGAPGTGEIDFRLFVAAIVESGYRGWVGLEYIAGAETSAGLSWMDALQESLGERASAWVSRPVAHDGAGQPPSVS